MTATTAPVKRTPSADVEPNYEALLSQVQQAFATDVETRFKLATLLGKMLKLKPAEVVAEDTDMTPGGVVRIAQVAEFWGRIRIAADGKRRAPWFIYDRVALDQVMTDQQKQTIKQAAPKQGLKVVRQMIKDARQVSVHRVNEVVNGKRAAKTTSPRPGHGYVTGGSAKKPVPVAVDGHVYVDRALTNIEEAARNLDQLESLSEDDAAIIRAKVNDVVAQLVRLTQVS